LAILSSLTARFAPAQRTLPALLQYQAEQDPDRMLFKAGDTAWSVKTCRAIAARSAATLHEAGVGAGDRVALICGNRSEFLQVFLGAAWLGAITVPINTAARGPQLRHILSDCGARLLIIEAEFRPHLDLIDFETLPIERIWVIDGDMPPLGDDTLPPAELSPETTIAVLYTSGTTGPSKGVCCPHAQYFWWGAITGDLLGLVAGDVLVTTLPLFHTNALNAFFQALLHDATLVVEPRFSATTFWTALAAHDATVTFVLGAMVPILLSRPPSPHDRAHRARIALAPGVPGHLHAPFTERFGIGLVDGFGSTETNFVIGTTLDRQIPGWMGPVYSGFAARVLDDAGHDVPDGISGELALRTDEPLAFATGYLGLPDKTREAWRDGWFHTGDRVIRRADGYFRFVDRLKDSIRRRGENVSSFEVEQVLLSHPAIATAAAFPVRSELAEDDIMVALVLRPGEHLAPEALMAFCEPRMAYFAIPRYVAFMDRLPTTENGKVQKFKLREQGIIPGAWDRDAAGYRLSR
jgi:crotonobetaine/carnitine-CoA ligase